MIAAIYALVLTLALAVPYVAEAECAWVLWMLSSMKSEKHAIPHHTGVWMTLSALKTREACLREAKAQAKKDQSFTQVEGGYNGRGASDDIERWNSYRCYPDTVDPRGPKGGK